MQPLVTLIPEQIEAIKNQTFSNDSPGTLLKDFSAVLSFMGIEGVEVSKSTQAFAAKHLPELNALLSRPLDIQLKRPMQKSYPAINGLYLLLRASGLTYVDIGKKQNRLLLNQNVLASWEALNPIERYFALIDAWWYRGSEEIIGERTGFGGWGCYFYSCIWFFKKTLQDKHSKLEANDFDDLRYSPGFHYLALMELFGFVEITLDTTVSKANWPIVKLEPTGWGDTLFAYFSKNPIESDLFEEEEEQPEMLLVGEIRKHRPDLNNTLLLPESKLLTDASVIFKVILDKASRTLAISSNANLDELAYAILKAFAFDSDHLYEFSYKNVYGLTESISHPYAENEMGLFTSDRRVGDMPLYVGMNLTFLFDFGDNWEFLLVVEAFDPEGKPPSQPKVIGREGKPPKQYGNY